VLKRNISCIPATEKEVCHSCSLLLVCAWPRHFHGDVEAVPDAKKCPGGLEDFAGVPEVGRCMLSHTMYKQEWHSGNGISPLLRLPVVEAQGWRLTLVLLQETRNVNSQNAGFLRHDHMQGRTFF
jgi:hypothetical protein